MSEALPVTAVVATSAAAEKEEAQAPATQSQQAGGAKKRRSIQHFLAGGAADGDNTLAEATDGAKRQKKEPETQIVQYNGQHVTVFKGEHAAEDPRWVQILEVKDNGTKKYRCVRCGWERTCKVGVLIDHMLRTGGKLCTKTPTTEMSEKLSRFKASTSTALSAIVKTQAVAQTPGIIAHCHSKQEQATAAVDEALAKLICTFDLPWNAFDSRNELYTNFLLAIKQAPHYSAPKREKLSDHLAPTNGARPGGLYLADESCKRERNVIIRAIGEGQMIMGATMVSDGAKIKSRKLSMLNTSIVTAKGVLPVQQTDATGIKKDGVFLADDLSTAVEKVGTFEVVSRKKPNGEVVQKKSSAIVKVVILDRGGGCERALSILEERWRVLGDTCKGHGADLLIEDWAKPFKAFLKSGHELIIFITSHDAIYGIFTSYEGVRALDLPADTRFATEVICMRSMKKDKSQIKLLFVDPGYEAWFIKQDAKTKAKARRMKELVLGDSFWHKTDVFTALAGVAETSLRILDSNTPNLKDAAFAFDHVEKEVGNPLVSTLAAIPDWGEIDLGLDLRSEHLGNLAKYAKAMVKKRKGDFLSTPVLAAAAVNPIYTFSSDESKLWVVPGGDSAVRVCIAKLYWGEDAKQSDAIDGWDRFATQRGIYDASSIHFGLLQAKANSNNAEGFYRHVHGISTLAADKAFAQFALIMVSAFANQGAAERHNKYVADMHSKKRTRLDMDKARAMTNVKMTEIYKRAVQRAEKRDQSSGTISIAQDLRGIYVHARALASEKRELQLRLTALNEAEREEEAEAAQVTEEEGPQLITIEDAAEVLDETETPLRIPDGYQVQSVPSPSMVDPTEETSDVLLEARIQVRFKNYGWCVGTIKSKVTSRRRTIQQNRVNFTAVFDMDQGRATDLSLEVDMYDSSPSAEYESWFLMEPIEEE